MAPLCLTILVIFGPLFATTLTLLPWPFQPSWICLYIFQHQILAECVAGHQMLSGHSLQGISVFLCDQGFIFCVIGPFSAFPNLVALPAS